MVSLNGKLWRRRGGTWSQQGDYAQELYAGWGREPRHVPTTSRRRGGTSPGLAAVRWLTFRWACSPSTATCCANRLGSCTGRGTETATTSHGAIDGAVRSGERAVREILG